MSTMINLFCESAEVAFLLGTFLYAMAFAGDLLFSRFWDAAGGVAGSPVPNRLQQEV